MFHLLLPRGEEMADVPFRGAGEAIHQRGDEPSHHGRELLIGGGDDRLERRIAAVGPGCFVETEIPKILREIPVGFRAGEETPE